MQSMPVKDKNEKTTQVNYFAHNFVIKSFLSILSKFK